MPFINDVAITSPVTHYENANGTYKTIPRNSGIRRFIWEHLANINQILQRLKYVGGTLSGEKLKLCVCKGNLTIPRRILHIDLAKGNPK
jgi:hypothetical protein